MMRYLLALFAPPLALLSCGMVFSFVFNLIFFAIAWAFLFAAVGLFSIPLGFVAAFFLLPLAVIFWFISVFHAILAVGNYAEERRDREMLITVERTGRPS